jgi:hypothetical protein
VPPEDPPEDPPGEPPTRRHDERLEAPIKAAADLRTHRHDLVAAISNGTMQMADLLAADDPRTAQVKVLIFAEAVPGVGKVTSRRLLSGIGIADGTRWGELAGPVARRIVAAVEQARETRAQEAQQAATAGGASPADGT